MHALVVTRCSAASTRPGAKQHKVAPCSLCYIAGLDEPFELRSVELVTLVALAGTLQPPHVVINRHKLRVYSVAPARVSSLIHLDILLVCRVQHGPRVTELLTIVGVGCPFDFACAARPESEFQITCMCNIAGARIPIPGAAQALK
jgi:hypothetical protein